MKGDALKKLKERGFSKQTLGNGMNYKISMKKNDLRKESKGDALM